jgi:hypothetical protein
MADRQGLRLSATLLFVGVIASLVAGFLHPAQVPANDHPAVFAEYAASQDWTLIHLGQFVGMAILVAGLLVLYYAIDVRRGGQGWVARFGALTAAISLGLYGVLQAVDGVALKQAVDAWARAPEVEKAARFANAETVRWLEWAARSYQSFVFGAALVLLGAAIAWSARIPRPIGYLMSLSGVGYIAQGLVIGSEGFSPANAVPTLSAYASIIAWSVWLIVAAVRMRGSDDASAEPTALPGREAA